MKKLFSILAVFGVLSLGLTGAASAKCYDWKKVCKPVYKYKTWWGTCYDKYHHPYKCKKTKKIHVGTKCHKVCIGWKKPHHYNNHHGHHHKKHHNSY